MIQLTRLNNTVFAVNCDLIKYVEESPDTVITLVNGEKLVVRETAWQVVERVREFRRSIFPAASEMISASSEQENTSLKSNSSAAARTDEKPRG